jgi:mannose-6-phosphate isomerase-like protein (cupin superfamily)
MSYTKKKLRDVEDKAPGFGLSETQEARFVHYDLDAEDTGLAYHVVKPGKRQGFGHRHEKAEELHVILSGSGRVKIDDDIVELQPMDAIRISPESARRFEAGPDGLEYVVFGVLHGREGESLPDFWAPGDDSE